MDITGYPVQHAHGQFNTSRQWNVNMFLMCSEIRMIAIVNYSWICRIQFRYERILTYSCLLVTQFNL